MKYQVKYYSRKTSPNRPVHPGGGVWIRVFDTEEEAKKFAADAIKIRGSLHPSTPKAPEIPAIRLMREQYSRELTVPQINEVAELLGKEHPIGGKIKAIKAVREYTGLGLKEAPRGPRENSRLRRR